LESTTALNCGRKGGSEVGPEEKLTCDGGTLFEECRVVLSWRDTWPLFPLLSVIGWVWAIPGRQFSSVEVVPQAHSSGNSASSGGLI
jgi:hypothetical protein